MLQIGCGCGCGCGCAECLCCLYFSIWFVISDGWWRRNQSQQCTIFKMFDTVWYSQRYTSLNIGKLCYASTCICRQAASCLLRAQVNRWRCYTPVCVTQSSQHISSNTSAETIMQSIYIWCLEDSSEKSTDKCRYRVAVVRVDEYLE